MSLTVTELQSLISDKAPTLTYYLDKFNLSGGNGVADNVPQGNLTPERIKQIEGILKGIHETEEKSSLFNKVTLLNKETLAKILNASAAPSGQDESFKRLQKFYNFGFITGTTRSHLGKHSIHPATLLDMRYDQYVALDETLSTLEELDPSKKLTEANAALLQGLIKEKSLEYMFRTARLIGQSAAAMINSKISFDSIFADVRLQKLVNLKTPELERIVPVLTYLSKKGELNEDIFDKLVGEAPYLADIRTKPQTCDTGPKITDLLEKLTTLGASSKATLDTVLELAEDRTSLENAADVFSELAKDSSLKLKEDELKTLLEAIKEHSQDTQARPLANELALIRCLKTIERTLPVFKDKETLKTLFKYNADQLKGINNIVASLNASTDTNHAVKKSFLDKKTLQDVINSPHPFPDEVVNVFNAMREAGIPLEGHRHNLLTTSKEGLQMLTALFKESKNSQLDKNTVSALINSVVAQDEAKVNAQRANEPVVAQAPWDSRDSAAYGKQVGLCIQLMKAGKIPLSHTLPGSSATDNVSRLLALDGDKLAKAYKLLGALGGTEQKINKGLDSKAFDYVLDGLTNATTGEAFKNKADSIAQVFEKLNKSRVDLSGIRHNILEMSAEELKTFASLLPEPSRLNFASIRGLSQEEVKVLIDNVPNINSQGYTTDAAAVHANNVKDCIKHMQQCDIPLVGGFPDRNNLERLLKLDANQLGAVSELFKSFYDEKNRPFLDRNSFNSILDKMADPEFVSKTSAISGVFSSMKGLSNVDPKKHWESILDMDSDKLTTLSDVIAPKGRDGTPIKTLTDKQFTILQTSLPDFTGKDGDRAGYCSKLNACIRGAAARGMDLETPEEAPVYVLKRQSRLEKLTKMDASQLEAVDTVLRSLTMQYTITAGQLIAKANTTAVDSDFADVFDCIVKEAQAGDVDGFTQKVGGKTKAQYVAETFSAMESNGITPLKGHRRAIMHKSPDELKALTDILDTARAKQETIDRDTFRYLRKNDLSPLKPAETEILSKCIQLLQANKIHIGPALSNNKFSIGDDKITKLMKLKPAERAEVERVMTCLNKKGDLNADCFNTLISQAKSLTDKHTVNGVEKTKGQLLVNAYENLRDKGKSVQGRRGTLMEKSVDELAGFNAQNMAVHKTSAETFHNVKNRFQKQQQNRPNTPQGETAAEPSSESDEDRDNKIAPGN